MFGLRSIGVCELCRFEVSVRVPGSSPIMLCRRERWTCKVGLGAGDLEFALERQDVFERDVRLYGLTECTALR